MNSTIRLFALLLLIFYSHSFVSAQTTFDEYLGVNVTSDMPAQFANCADWARVFTDPASHLGNMTHDNSVSAGPYCEPFPDANGNPICETCGDGVDNDGNGLVDCDDPKCFVFCSPLYEHIQYSSSNPLIFEICDNGIDDDGDGNTDCDDAKCTRFFRCQSGQTSFVPSIDPFMNCVAFPGGTSLASDVSSRAPSQGGELFELNYEYAGGGDFFSHKDFLQVLRDNSINKISLAYVRSAPRWSLAPSNNTNDRLVIPSQFTKNQGVLTPLGDLSDPISYKPFADYIGQIGAVLGSGSSLSTDAVRSVSCSNFPAQSTNQGLIDFIESSNEADKFWGPDLAYYDPPKQAALLHAVGNGRDANGAQLTSTYNGSTYNIGLNNMASGVQHVIGAPYELRLSNPHTRGPASIDYINAVYIDYSTRFGAGNWPVDKLNFHQYFTASSNQAENSAMSPEQWQLELAVETMYNDIHPDLSGLPVWLSEFGYNAEQGYFASPNLSTFTNGVPSGEQIQADWTARSFLIGYKSGIERAGYHWLADEEFPHVYTPQEPYNTAWDKITGLVKMNENGTFAPRTSWFYTISMKNILMGAGRPIFIDREVYDKDGDTVIDPSDCSEKDASSCGSQCAYIYEFPDSKYPGSKIYAVWAPSACKNTFEVPFKIDNGMKATAISLVHGSTNGFSFPLQTIDDIPGQPGKHIILPVSETPLFFYVQPDNSINEVPCASNLMAVTSTCSSATIKWDAWSGLNDYKVFYTPATNINSGSLVDPTLLSVKYVSKYSNQSFVAAQLLGIEEGTEYVAWVLPSDPLITVQGLNLFDLSCSISVFATETTGFCRFPVSSDNLVEASTPEWAKLFDASLSPTECDPFSLEVCANSDCNTDPSIPEVFGRYDFTLDFGDIFSLSNITYSDLSNSGSVEIFASVNGDNYVPLLSFTTTAFNEWQSIPMLSSEQFQFLRFEISEGANMGEVFLCLQPQVNINPPPSVTGVVLYPGECEFMNLTFNCIDSDDPIVYTVVVSPEDDFSSPIFSKSFTFFACDGDPNSSWGDIGLPLPRFFHETLNVRIIASNQYGLTSITDSQYTLQDYCREGEDCGSYSAPTVLSECGFSANGNIQMYWVVNDECFSEELDEFWVVYSDNLNDLLEENYSAWSGSPLEISYSNAIVGNNFGGATLFGATVTGVPLDEEFYFQVLFVSDGSIVSALPIQERVSYECSKGNTTNGRSSFDSGMPSSVVTNEYSSTIGSGNNLIEIFDDVNVESIQNFSVYSIDGKVLLHDEKDKSSALRYLNELSSGFYILHVQSTSGDIQNFLFRSN